MGQWYQVTKTINGHRYLYQQRTWREGKHVRTESRYVGPAQPVERAPAPRLNTTRSVLYRGRGSASAGKQAYYGRGLYLTDQEDLAAVYGEVEEHILPDVKIWDVFDNDFTAEDMAYLRELIQNELNIVMSEGSDMFPRWHPWHSEILGNLRRQGMERLAAETKAADFLNKFLADKGYGGLCFELSINTTTENAFNKVAKSNRSYLIFPDRGENSKA